MELKAEAIVAGSRELDRRESVLNELMGILSNAITIEYQEARPYSVPPSSLDVLWSKLQLEIPGLEICTLTDDRRSEFGLKAVFINSGARDTYRYWRKSERPQGLSIDQIRLLWAYRNKIVEAAIRNFPNIEEHLLIFDCYAPAQ